MPESATLRVDPTVRDRLAALAVSRGMDPADLVAELVFEAETAQVVAEVNAELEKLTQRPLTPDSARAHERDEMRRVEATVSGWLQT